MSPEERQELIFICTLMSNYSEEYLQKASDEELNEIYNNSMKSGLDI